MLPLRDTPGIFTVDTTGNQRDTLLSLGDTPETVLVVTAVNQPDALLSLREYPRGIAKHPAGILH